MIAGLTRRNILALLGVAAPAAAFAAPYPEKPVRLIVALAPGGPADTAARVFAPAFAEVLGQNVLVDNRPGGSAVVGTEAAIRSSPDGYTLLFASSSTLAINPAVLKNLRFDAHKDLKLIGLVCYTPHVLVVRASLPVQTLADLVRFSKAQPDTLRYGSSGSAAPFISLANWSSARPAPTCDTFPIAAAGRRYSVCSPVISRCS